MIRHHLLRSSPLLLLLLTGCTPGVPQVEQAAHSARPATDAPASSGTYRPPSSSSGVRSQAFVPGRAGRVFIFAGVNDACQPLPAPEVTVTRPPAKGEVSLRPGQDTTLAASVGGSCIGAKTRGTGVYYTARAGTSGSDSFTVTGRLASGETMTRDFEVQIAE